MLNYVDNDTFTEGWNALFVMFSQLTSPRVCYELKLIEVCLLLLQVLVGESLVKQECPGRAIVGLFGKELLH